MNECLNKKTNHKKLTSFLYGRGLLQSNAFDLVDYTRFEYMKNSLSHFRLWVVKYASCLCG